MVHTTSSIFLKTLADCGITHAFVNWGSDHPALLEDLARQRVESGQALLEIVTCPNEMVALSAAQGYAQVTGNPAAVIVHVDVGTLALAGALHNVDRSHTPVLIYAGAAPFSQSGLSGSRNEWIMWAQDVPDQTAIVRQYMRFTAQIQSSHQVADITRRALQIATSVPRGPVYLWARREVMEEEVADTHGTPNDMLSWPSVEPTALSESALNRIVEALSTAKSPLIVTSRLGKNLATNAPAHLVALSIKLAIPIISVCPSVVNLAASHPYYLGTTFLAPGTHTEHLSTADVILIIDADVPWVPLHSAIDPEAKVFIIDSGDPLHATMGYWHFPAELICRADPGVALSQIVDAVQNSASRNSGVDFDAAVNRRGADLTAVYQRKLAALDVLEDTFDENVPLSLPNLLGAVRKAIDSTGSRTLILNESISNFNEVWSHLRPEELGSMFSSGASSLGWGIGAAVGACLGDLLQGNNKYELVVLIVGDGSFLFGVPSAAYWMARRYNTPFLTIVLNNGGWKSPKLSMLGVHSDGHGSKLPPGSGEQLTVEFGPHCSDYSGIAVAASDGWAHGKRFAGNDKKLLEDTLEEAVKIVKDEKRCAVLDFVLASL